MEVAGPLGVTAFPPQKQQQQQQQQQAALPQIQLLENFYSMHSHGRAESRERDVLACLRFSVHGVVKSHPGGPMWEQCALRAPGSPWADESR